MSLTRREDQKSTPAPRRTTAIWSIIIADLLGIYLSLFPLFSPLFLIAEFVREANGLNPLIVDRGEADIALFFAPVALFVVLIVPIFVNVRLGKASGIALWVRTLVPAAVGLIIMIVNGTGPEFPVSQIIIPAMV